MKYDELDFFEFFESEPIYLFEKEASICSYSYEKDDFKIYASLSCYEDYMSIDISYKSGTVYSGEIRNIEEIKKPGNRWNNIFHLVWRKNSSK